MSSERKAPNLLRRLKAALRRRGGAKETEQAQEHARKIRLMYENFREILAGNDSTLQLIADIEDRLSGRVPFSLNLIVRRIQRAILDVFMMVKDLDLLTGGGYPDLYDALRRVNVEFESELSPPRESIPGPLVVPLDRVRAADAPLVGTKMANLGEIKNVIGLAVPEGFAVTTVAFARFMARDDLEDKAAKLEELVETHGPRVVAEACREVQQKIIDAEMSADLEKAILEEFDRIAGGRELLVAVRSSGVAEDKAASHAGLFYTELQVGRGWLLDTYRWVLASSYGIGPVLYRLKQGLTMVDAPMAAGCLGMIDPRCSGVMFSRSFEDPQANKVVISVTPGLPDVSLVGGANVENIVVTPGAELTSPIPCLSDAEVSELTIAARRLEAHFEGPQDIEWVIDQSGRLFILQCRPMAALSSTEAADVPRVEATREPLLSGGSTACAGVGAGPVFVVRNESDLDRFPDCGVLVSRHSSPRFSVVMSRCSAIVTDEGSPIGHMAILAREYGVPTIVGLRGAMMVLDGRHEATVDATSRCVYEGMTTAVTVRFGGQAPLRDTPAVRKLRRMARAITPLKLIDTASSGFAPANCASLHDITRFVHEKVFEAMFHLGDRAALTQPDSLTLGGNLPYKVLVLDVGGGVCNGAGVSGAITTEDILSIPMQAFLAGLLDPRVRWDKPRAVSASGFLSVLGEGIAGRPAAAQGVGRTSFAIISDRYMNFSTKAGYHFNTVDTYCGKSLNKNYIHFRFEGGAAAEVRRERRCRFLSIILNTLNFKVQARGDVVVARLEKYDRELIHARLIDLGRLTLCSRQLDMLMDTDSSPDYFAQAFLAGELERF